MSKVNSPITGICSFAKYPICTDLNELQADMAILGVPYDLGVGFLSGTRLGPRRVREASTQYGRGDAGFYDPERDEVYLAAPWKIIDVGDADIINGDIQGSFDNIEWAVRKMIEQGATPVVIGGDHSISIPAARALDTLGPVTVVQFDAHLDWSDAPGGQRYGNGSPMRRMSEMDHIQGMAQIGIRGLGSSRKVDFDDAREYGSVIVTASQARELGVDGVMERIPASERYYVTIDIDALDISVAPGTGSPMPGGLSFTELNAYLEALTRKGEIVGFDFVEVAPQYDPAGVTVRVAAMTILSFMGHILKRREQKRDV
ncbi:agmatinase [Paenibacillus allorhizosphaerae]|uniref:Proclavaminate amidinohydrolase n=1 Tax=Paenibacillus allorhizosphaerae TaxID=2849866 RepID=A0ABN7TJH6_9BACL|nr:agmatinase [Paenibacillus allorhizosphaerae]CAG7638516.1 Proclavaminate amidinohydrolase [Paenibacillus allorhizosphaerae]